MAKGKDIAGLAALGTLAYMMGRKQGAAPSTSSGDNKPTVTPAAVAPPRPVTSNSEEARQAASDVREDMRNDQQVNAVGASAPVAVRPPAPAPVSAPAPAKYRPAADSNAASNAMAARPPAPAPARYRPAEDSNAASKAMASRDIYPERAATRDAAADAARRARMAAAVTQGIGRGQSTEGMKRGGAVKGYANGGSVSSRADGIAQRGKTNCKIC
jgi:hypothetical protein